MYDDFNVGNITEIEELLLLNQHLLKDLRERR
jgi:hypothetical protein